MSNVSFQFLSHQNLAVPNTEMGLSSLSLISNKLNAVIQIDLEG